MPSLKKKNVAVIGAGISGLTCAYELQKAGFEVTVFEKEDYVGGRMATRISKGLPFDIGANHLCDLYDHIKEYCAEFDIEFQPMETVNYGIFRNGKIMPPDRVIGWFSKILLAIQMLRSGRDGRWMNFFNLSTTVDYDRGNGYDFMKRRCGRIVADYIADPFSSTYQFHRAREISLGALLGVMESVKNEKPGWYLHHLNGQMSALPNAFGKRLNVKIKTPAKSVVAGVKKVKVETKGTKNYDAVVMASTASATEKIYKNPTRAQKNVLKQTVYSSTVGFSFKVDVAKLPDTFIVWVPYVEGGTVSGYTNELMKGPELIHKGKSLICMWLHEDFAKPLLKKSDKELFAIAKEELLKYCPWFTSTDELENHDLQRWPEAIPKYSPGHITRVHDFMKEGQGEKNVFFCGDYLNSLWTEGSVQCGQRVAEQVIEQLSS